MPSRLEQLGILFKIHREHKNKTQADVAAECGFDSRTVVAYLEQGRALPKQDALTAMCKFIDMPKPLWAPFINEESTVRFEFENRLAEFIGKSVSLDMHDDAARQTAESQINRIFHSTPTREQLIDIFNSILVYYGVGPISVQFFNRYFEVATFSSIDEFGRAVERYQMDAIRLFPTFSEAFDTLNNAGDVDDILRPLQIRSLKEFQDRTDWDKIEPIADDLLPDLGYISAQRVRQESAERKWLIDQLRHLSSAMRKKGLEAQQELAIRTRGKIDSLLRKFESTIPHGVSSPLFGLDADLLEREADRLAPKTDAELKRMEDTQQKALRNLAHYLAADFMDVYVATSMRTIADYISVNNFVSALFSHDKVRPHKLRYFNPTQSWVDDRVAKGLVEALMLKRASVTVYMAQKTDTFGKDSEASVALGQGKPVIVFVPKLTIGEAVDSEKLFSLGRSDLVQKYDRINPDEKADDTMDDENLISGIMKNAIEVLKDKQICKCVKQCYADFDLYSEANRFDEKLRQPYRAWLDDVVSEGVSDSIPADLRPQLVGALVAAAINFERRAKVFREIHPLALQVILSTGVLNGIVVVRTVDQCGRVLDSIVRNKMELESRKDDSNYRVVERLTGSTIRVISRHELLRNAFEAYYRRLRLSGAEKGG